MHVTPEIETSPLRNQNAFVAPYGVFVAPYVVCRGTAVEQWLRCCATNRKVAGSIPDGVIGIFHWHKPPDRTMALGSSTRRISWG